MIMTPEERDALFVRMMKDYIAQLIRDREELENAKYRQTAASADHSQTALTLSQRESTLPSGPG